MTAWLHFRSLCPIPGYIYNAHGLGREHNFYLNLGHAATAAGCLDCTKWCKALILSYFACTSPPYAIWITWPSTKCAPGSWLCVFIVWISGDCFFDRSTNINTDLVNCAQHGFTATVGTACASSPKDFTTYCSWAIIWTGVRCSLLLSFRREF